MTNQEILTKAIQKAIDGGWNPQWDSNRWRADGLGVHVEITEPNLMINHGREYHGYLPYEQIIFSHDFARALWGEETKHKTVHRIGSGASFDAAGNRFFEQTDNPGWRFHLQQMVIADDPIKYLGATL